MSLMSRIVLACVFLLSLASFSSAQQTVPVPSPSPLGIAWDHDGLNLEEGGFRLLVDGKVLIDNIPASERRIPFPALPPGVHNLTVRAFSLAGESGDSNVLSLRVVIIPTTPGNVRIVALE